MKSFVQYISEAKDEKAKIKKIADNILLDTDTRRFLKANKVLSFSALLKKSNESRGGNHDFTLISPYTYSLIAKVIGILIKKYPEYDFSGTFFNSGYHGYSVEDSKLLGGKLLLILTPGKIGLENHAPALIEWAAAGSRSNSFKHEDKQFGDVNMNDTEFDKCVEFLVNEFDKFALK